MQPQLNVDVVPNSHLFRRLGRSLSILLPKVDNATPKLPPHDVSQLESVHVDPDKTPTLGVDDPEPERGRRKSRSLARKISSVIGFRRRRSVASGY
jgi:hypothetical protein